MLRYDMPNIDFNSPLFTHFYEEIANYFSKQERVAFIDHSFKSHHFANTLRRVIGRFTTIYIIVSEDERDRKLATNKSLGFIKTNIKSLIKSNIMSTEENIVFVLLPKDLDFISYYLKLDIMKKVRFLIISYKDIDKIIEAQGIRITKKFIGCPIVRCRHKSLLKLCIFINKKIKFKSKLRAYICE